MCQLSLEHIFLFHCIIAKAFITLCTNNQRLYNIEGYLLLPNEINYGDQQHKKGDIMYICPVKIISMYNFIANTNF